jgi:transcriptional regulator with XRE-family HTH domain
MDTNRFPQDPRDATWQIVDRLLDDAGSEVVAAIREGEEDADWEASARDSFEQAIAVAKTARAEWQRQATAEGSTIVRLHEVAALSMKTLRTASELTQQQLADEMAALGFVGWKRITVAETESFKRRLSLEELLGVAIIFGTDVASLLAAYKGYETVTLNEQRVLTTAQARELVTGWPMDTPWFGIRVYPHPAAEILREMVDIQVDAWLWAADVRDNPGAVVLDRLEHPDVEKQRQSARAEKASPQKNGRRD